MLGVYASAAVILVGSLVVGRALLHLLGLAVNTWLSGVVGFAVLTVACPLLIRLPGRAMTLAILLGLVTVVAMLYLWQEDRGTPLLRRGRSSGGARRRRSTPAAGVHRGEPGAPRSDWGVAILVALIVLVVASLPFAFNERDGVLGEGIYTNDQAAQLYWSDWLQNGVGPEPNPVRFGYPTGPQSIAAASAEVTGATLLDSFNGLLIAIPILTALTALAGLEALPHWRRILGASLTALPYLAASFLAQSAFKETAMALLVLAFAVALRELSAASRDGPYRGSAHPRRALIVALVLIAAASVFVYSVPGLVWFLLAVPIWLVLELVAGSLRLDLGAMRDAVRSHRVVIIVGVAVILVVAAFSATRLSGFIDKVGMVQASAGRLSSPVFPGEALGIWPEGDFRIVRGDVTGAYPAVALGLLAAAIGAAGALRRRDWGLISMGASVVIVYVGAQLFASIYVEAKALAIMSPLVVMAAMHALLAPRWQRDDATESTPAAPAEPEDGGGGASPPGLRIARYALGGVVAAALAVSTLLALRATPVGFDQHGTELEGLSGLVQNHSVAFLGVDRFGGYWLRGTLVESPGGYVPSSVKPRPKKTWDQGLPMDFDTLPPGRLDEFDYVITTRAGYQSTPPPNFRPVVRTPSYVLWKRVGKTPQLGIIDKRGTPGRVLACPQGPGHGLAGHEGTATVLPRPVVRKPKAWSLKKPFDAPGTVTQRLRLSPGNWELSLQYNSQVPLVVSAAGESFTLPPSLDGMYLTHQGEGAYWPAGKLHSNGGPVTVTVSAKKPAGFQRLLGVRRQVWLGTLAATRPGSKSIPLHDACGRFVDHFVVSGRHPEQS